MGWDPKRIADPAWFLDRERELRALRELIKARDNVLVYGPRRLGKTSLLRRVAVDLPEQVFLHVDCPFAPDEAALAQHILDALQASGLARTTQFLERARKAVKNLAVSVEVGGEGVVLRVSRGPDRPEALPDALEFVTRVARAAGVHAVLVLDEFQSVMETSEATIGRLRSHAQSQDAVSYVLSGSRAGVLVVLTRRKNPFWRQLTEFPVGPLDLDAALRDVQRLTGMRVTAPSRRLIADTVAPSTQRLVELLDILHRRYGAASVEAVRDALEVLVGRHADAFERVFGALTPYQRRVLVAMAVHRPEHPTGASFVQANGLRAASHVQKALAALRREEILTDDHRFEDPLFRLFVVRGAGGRT